MCLATLCVFLVAACCYDYKDKRIPNHLLIWMAILGVGWRFWNQRAHGALSYLGQAALVMAFLYLFFKIGCLGAGDVKLLGATAGYLPADKVLAFLMCSLLIAAVISLMKMWKKDDFYERMRYLAGYLAAVAKSGSLRLYVEDRRERQRTGICLSGPVLASVLLYLGGVY